MSWEQKTLGELVEALIDHRGRTPKKLGTDFVANGVPVLSAQLVTNGFIDWSNTRFVDQQTFELWMPQKLKKSDVLLTSEAPLGRTAILNREQNVVLGQRLFALRGKRGVLDNHYLHYWLRSDKGQAVLTSHAQGTTVIGIRQSSLRSISVDLPSITTQKAIAAVLGALDDKIAANQRVISDAAELCEALVQKSISGEFTKLSEIAVITMGTSPKGEHLNEEGRGIPFFQGVRDFGDISPKRRVYTDKPLRTAEPGDVLLAVRAPIGQVNLALEKVCIGRGLAAVRSAINSPVSLFYLLRSHREIWQDFDGNGTVFSSVNRSDAHNVLVPIILPTKQKDLEKVLNTIHGRLLKAQKENQVLAATRDELLPLLMNGKITVAEAEEAVWDVGVVKQKQQEEGDSDV